MDADLIVIGAGQAGLAAAHAAERAGRSAIVLDASDRLGGAGRQVIRYAGQVLHSSGYRSPASVRGERVVVVGGGNSAVQIAVELARSARVTLATRSRLRWIGQRPLGRDLHWWLSRTGLDAAPLGRWLNGAQPVLDDGAYRAAIAAGRPHLPYLAGTGALDGDGVPIHSGGVSTTVPGLGFVGLELQRAISSATIRGVARDADRVVGKLPLAGAPARRRVCCRRAAYA